jgi:hypothetical protein
MWKILIWTGIVASGSWFFGAKNAAEKAAFCTLDALQDEGLIKIVEDETGELIIVKA